MKSSPDSCPASNGLCPWVPMGCVLGSRKHPQIELVRKDTNSQIAEKKQGNRWCPLTAVKDRVGDDGRKDA